jgi:MerR family transcriptional regulator, light-induced transcriptional regulator
MDLREAADALGVHYQTAYGWVRQGILPARKVGRGYAVSEVDVSALAAQRRRGAEPVRPVRVRDWAATSHALYLAIVSGEETAARHQLERLWPGVRMIDLCERVIAPALRQIGDDWAAGLVSIAEEHRASAICERLIAAHANQPAGRPHGRAVVATPPGERHSLPALMAAACLRESRWLVHHLASDLPVEEVIRLGDQTEADLVVLSSATSQAARQARQAAAAIIGSRPHMTVLAGQPGDGLHDLLDRAANRPAAARGIGGH